MTIRERLEQEEAQRLSPRAVCAKDTRGREKPIDPCPMRTDFQRDRDRIIHCKAFRRLKYKTQVFLAPEGDHYRTRLTHTLEVAQIARTLARCLQLTEDLTEAIALGHDLGHTPFGHAGERAINAYTGHFKHNEQSLRVVKYYGREGRGLNLTLDVCDAIVNHTGDTLPKTLEGQIVRRCDRIAYLCHDFDDGCKVGIIGPDKLPGIVAMRLGTKPSQILDILVRNVVESSAGKQIVSMDKYYEEAMDEFRCFMFDYVYLSPPLKNEHRKAEHVVTTLLDLYMHRPEMLPQEYAVNVERHGLQQVVVDYIASLTDAAAVQQFSRHYLPVII